MSYTLACDAGAYAVTGQSARRGATAFCSISATAIWFPVAPGVTSLPAAPAEVINPSPVAANQATLPADWNDDAPDLCYLFQDILPVGQAPLFPTEQTVSYVHLPFLETVETVGITKARLVVNEFPYALTLPGEAVTLRTRARMAVIVASLSVDAGAVALTGQDATIQLVIFLGASTGTYQLLGENVNLYSTAPNYTLGCDQATFSLMGQDAGPLRMFADHGLYEVQGMNTTTLAEKTKLILHFDGSFESDAQSNQLTPEVYGSAGIATDYVKWGTGSGQFSYPPAGAGLTGHAVAYDDPMLAPGTDDFSIECWVYLPISPNAAETIFQLPTTTAGDGRLYGIYVSSSNFKIAWDSYTGTFEYSSQVTNGAWHHVWLARQAGVIRLAVDGVEASSTFNDSSDYSYVAGAASRKAIIGNYTTGSTYGFGGRIDDLRYTVGAARALAVPSGPYPDE